MTVYSFAINWPAPFKEGWKQSGRRFATAEKAAKAMSDFLVVALENGSQIEGRLVEIANGEVTE